LQIADFNTIAELPVTACFVVGQMHAVPGITAGINSTSNTVVATLVHSGLALALLT